MNREMGGKVASGDSDCERAGAGRGFTLVELLVVMGIIALLVSILFPAITGVMVAVRNAATANVIKTLGVALEAFHGDWGVYPPSDNTHTDKLNGVTGPDAPFGYYNLLFALAGPNQKGWGSSDSTLPANNNGPFGGTATKAYPSYYLPDNAADMQWVDSSRNSHWGYVDVFRPSRPIFYYRYEPGDANPFDVTDNLTDSSAALLGFANQTHFQMLVKPTDPSGTQRWVRDDYLLISCGADRYWGYVTPTRDANGNVTGYTAATTTADAKCDDVANFNF